VRLAAILLLLPFWCRGADPSWQEVLQRIRANVGQQVSRVANYTCVESVERSYFFDSFNRISGCANYRKTPPKQLYMRDRLRLDVAVSEGREIFSWHGGKSFSSKGVDDVVQSGPISSGSFVGYLRNIFFEEGVKIRFAGRTSSAGGDFYVFDHVVPLGSSHYQVGSGKKRWIVPFHGRFSGSGTNFELTSLQIIADEMPPESEICNAGSEIEYQLVDISGKASLIPKSYVLDISNSNHLYTTSRSEYTQCREFRGESTLRFDTNDDAATQRTPVARDEWLPAGTTLHVRLRTPIDDRTSFTGDPVEGSLIDSVKVKGSGITIPKDAALYSVITRLEFYAEPFKHCLASIRFQRLTFGPNSFLLDAAPRSSNADRKWLAEAYQGRIPFNIAADLENGLFVWTSSHFHKDQHFAADWKTKAPAIDSPE
jgi:hypothetical protein